METLTHGEGAGGNMKRSEKGNMEIHGVGAAFAKPKGGDVNEQKSAAVAWFEQKTAASPIWKGSNPNWQRTAPFAKRESGDAKKTESDRCQGFEKQRAPWAKLKAELTHKRDAERSHKRWLDWRDANEQETDEEGTTSTNSKLKILLLMTSLHHLYKKIEKLHLDRQGFVEKQHTGRSTIDIPEGGGGTVGVDIQVPDYSQARAIVKVTEEKLGDLPVDIPAREEEDWKEVRKPKGKGKGKQWKKVKVTEEKLREIPDNMATRERENWKEEVKVTEEKLGEIPDDMATSVRENCKEKRKPKGKGKEEKPQPKRKPKRKPKHKPNVEDLKELDRSYMDDRDQILLSALLGPELEWEVKVITILHVVRCRGSTEYNKKQQCHVLTRFCLYNIAYFDLDKESEDVPWPRIDQIRRPLRNWLDHSVNVAAIKVAQSDRKGPISIYGTVLARDEYDYRCVYLFRRGRDDPQLITPKDRTLTLISPIRAFAVSDSMFFEFHLKIKGGDDADEDFSKGIIEHSAIRDTHHPTIKLLESCLSTMELVYTPVLYAQEASIAVIILKGPSDFTSKVTAWTTGNVESKIVLYNSEGAGTRTKLGPGETASGLVAVPLGEELVLYVSLAEEVQHQPEECFTLVIGPDVDERTLEQGPYRMQVKISWKGVVNHLSYSKRWGRPNMWAYIAGERVLLS